MEMLFLKPERESKNRIYKESKFDLYRKYFEYSQINVRNILYFLDYFYGINPSEKDKKDAVNFLKVHKLRYNKWSKNKICKQLGISKYKINHWLYDNNFPFIIRLLDVYLSLGKPKENMKWLSINSTKGGIFIGPWIQVPEKINSIDDIISVIIQLKPLDIFNRELKKIGITNHIDRTLLFLFILGILIGDSSKHGIKREWRMTRRITLRLSKRYPSNEKLGEFTSMCVNSMGLRMGRRKDCPAGKRNPYPFYTWISQSSTLIQWMFHVCLGLNDDERTTYDPIRADWLIHVPNEFKIWFLQGLAESDGFVDISSCQVGIITHPNTDLVRKMLESLSIEPTKRFFTHNKLWSLMININKSYKLPIFNPFIKSYRYKKMEKIYKADRITGHWPKWLNDEILLHIKRGYSGTKLVEKIIDKHNIVVKAQRINKKRRELVDMNKDVIKNKNEVICLGIESTAH